MLEGMWGNQTVEENVFFITLEREVGAIETSIECVGTGVAEEGGGKGRGVVRSQSYLQLRPWSFELSLPADSPF